MKQHLAHPQARAADARRHVRRHDRRVLRRLAGAAALAALLAGCGTVGFGIGIPIGGGVIGVGVNSDGTVGGSVGVGVGGVSVGVGTSGRLPAPQPAASAASAGR